MNYQLLLETYTLQDILEYNDVSEEECLEYLVSLKYIKLPDYQPLDYD